MSIKNILCAYTSDHAHASGLKHAIKLVRHYDGWLTGIMQHGRPMLEQRYTAIIPEDLLQEFRKADRKLIREVGMRFAKLAEKAGLGDRSEFIELDPETGGSILEYARNFDLIVTGLHSQSLSDGHLSANPDLIALHCGRPVLVVPNGYSAKGLADHALVAWDGRRSAARALGDALPILEETAKVTLLTIGKKPVPGTDVLLRNMARHKIEVELKLVTRKGNVARTILKVANDVSAKLVIMGAFEHSRFSHSLKGGPTTDIIDETHVPVFFSH